MATKKQNSHTSTRAKKAASKTTEPPSKSSAEKIKNQQLKRRKKLEELTLKMFQEVYDDYQQGKFHRIL